MADSDALIGQTVSHYRIIEKLGGMGVVYVRWTVSILLAFAMPLQAGLCWFTIECVAKKGSR